MTNFVKHKYCLLFLNPVLSDTLLNVFLAIAVDNLANAQELTKVKQFLCLRFTVHVAAVTTELF